MLSFIIDNFLLIAVALMSAGMLAWPYISKQKMGATVTNEELIQFINKKDAQVLDLRAHKDFKRGSIAGTKNFAFDTFAERIDTLAKDRPIIVLDAELGNSPKAAEMLRAKGFKDVYILEKGIKGWVEAKLPFSR